MMMWRRLHEIQGMQVVSLEEGRIMGSALKVYLSSTQKAVSGIQVRESGLGGDESWVDIRDVDKIGEHVVFIARAANCKAKHPVGRSLKDLMGMPVLSKDGRLLGSLVDVEVDEHWRVVELSLSENRLIGIQPEHAVFGADSILLEAGAADKVRSTVKPKTGFLARLFGSEAIQETADIISRAEHAQPRRPAATKPRPAKKTSRKKPAKKAAKKTTAKKPAKKSAKKPAKKPAKKASKK